MNRLLHIPIFILLFVNANANRISLSADSTKLSDTISFSPKIKVAKDSLEAQVIYSCRDSINFEVDSQKVYLFGDAKVEYKNIKLDAEFIIFDWKNNLIIAEGRKDSSGNPIGDPVFTEDQQYQAKKIIYNYRSKKGKISQLITQEGEGYVHGKKVKKNEEDELFIKGAKYTTCDSEDPHFYIAVSRLKVIPDKKIISGPAILKIEDVPTPLFLPFGFFPIKKGRRSGILLPEYGSDEERGFFLDQGGYYFALSEYFDLTLRGAIYTRGSWKGYAATNYNTLYKYNGNANISYSYFKNGDQLIKKDFFVSKDFKVNWTHRQDPKARPNSTFSADVHFGTSKFDKLNSYEPDLVQTNGYNSSINYSKRWNNRPYTFNFGASQSQNLQSGQVNITLPRMDFSVSTFSPLKRKKNLGEPRWYEKINTGYTFNAENTISENDSVLFKNDETLKNMKNGFKHSIPIYTSFKVFKHWTLTPRFDYTELWYLKTIRKSWVDDDSDTTNWGYVKDSTVEKFKTARFFSTSAALSTQLYGMLAFKKGKIKAIRHVLTPSLNFGYRPDFSNNSWYFSYQADSSKGNIKPYSIYEGGIYGGPPTGRSASVGLNIGNNLEMKVFSKKDTVNNTKKIKLLEALNFSASYNFIADSINLSDISISGRTTLFEKMAVNFGAIYTPYIIDNITNRKINRFQWDENKKLARLTSANITTGTTFNSKKKEINQEELSAEEAEMLGRFNKKYSEFYVPWSFGFNFGLSVTKSFSNQKDTVVKTPFLSFNFMLNPTSKWIIKVNSGYDFTKNDLTYTSVSIDRDLHCWEMKFNWIPFGNVRYSVQINVKSSLLQDLKLTKKKNWTGGY